MRPHAAVFAQTGYAVGMPAPGQTHLLPLLRSDAEGLWFGSEGDAVLVPRAALPPGRQAGDRMPVFVYASTPHEALGSLSRPSAEVGSFAVLPVVSVTRHGAFLDWGLEKDLLLPTAEQRRPVEVGERVVVAVHVDRDGRVTASSRLGSFFTRAPASLPTDRPVDLLVYGEAARGLLVVVDGRYSGMLYRDDTFAPLVVGDTVRGWVSAVRPDGKVDVTLRQRGREGMREERVQLVDALLAAGGVLPLTDHSAPEAIAAATGLSKKAFKRAVGALYKAGHLELGEREIRLVRRQGPGSS